MIHARMLLLALVIVATGCASAGGGDGTERPRRQQNLLTQEEILAAHHTNLYDVVATLRPGWLRTRGQISLADPDAGRVMVYVDGVRAGGVDYLRQLHASDARSLEYLNETQASARFGLQQGGGGCPGRNPA